MLKSDMKLAMQVVLVLLLHGCVFAQESKRLPPEDGKEGDGIMYPPLKDKQSMQCDSNISCSDCEVRMGKCFPDKNQCCFEKPPHIPCRDGIPCDKCRELNGTCVDDDDDDKCCFNKTGSERPPMQCYSNVSCVDCEARMGRCIPEGNMCCFEKPPHFQCREDIPCDKCEELNGTCGDGDDDECCFNSPRPEHPPMHCYNNLTCNDCEAKEGRCISDRNLCCFDLHPRVLCKENIPCDKCKEMDGACENNGKCCFRKTGDMDKDDEMSESNEKDSDWDSKDNDESRSKDRSKDGIDGYFVEHNGIKLRCIEKRCDPLNPKCGPKGICLEKERKCCLKPTEKEAQSKCEMERKRLNEKAGGSNHKEAEQINCTSDGSFLAKCNMNKNECHCLNASSGQTVGRPMRGLSKKNINCDKVQEETKAARVNVTFKVTDRPLSSFSNSELEEMKSSTKSHFESTVPVTVPKLNVYSGSVYMEVQLTKCNSNCFSTANTSDLYSLASEAVTQIEQGALVLNISGDTFIASSPSITDVMSVAEMDALQDDEPESEKRDGPKTELKIIIVVSVAVVLVAVALGISCYFYSRARHPMTKQEYFSDLTVKQGHENPVYLKA